MKPDDWSRLLATGEMALVGRMPWSSNATFLVELSDDTGTARAIYKPGAGERRLWDYDEGLYRREVAAYELSEAFGLGLVPTTVRRAEGPFGEGSLQRFIDADFSEHYFTLLTESRHHRALQLLAAFDVLVNNADRKSGHLLLDGEDRIWAIDNALCFAAEPNLRTVIWDFAGEAVPEALLEACDSLQERVPDAVAELISAAEARALVERAARLIETPRLPQPDFEERPYPWPLV